MANLASEVKRWLLLAQEERDKTALVKAHQMLETGGEAISASSELLTLCCEGAIELGAWSIAESCNSALATTTSQTHSLQARSLFCAALLRLHNVPNSLRGEALIDECSICISLVIKGLTMLIEDWPQEAEVVVGGLSHLWRAIEPLYVRGHFKPIVDVVEFAAVLFERLMIGGGFTYVQWMIRYATCLRGVGRQSEAVTQLNNALDAASRLGEERLQIQVMRILALACYTKETVATITSKGFSRNDATPSRAPLQHIVNTTQLFLASPYTPIVSSSQADLQTIFDALTGSANGSVGAGSSHVSSSAPPTKTSNGKPKTTRGGGGVGGTAGGGLLEGLSIGNPDIREELLSDVVLCLALCGDASRCQQVIPALLHSTNLRAKTFGTFASVVLQGRAAGFMSLHGAPDASYVDAAMVESSLHCIRLVEDTLESAKMIPDASECAYAVRVGCALLWVLCFPLFQNETHRHVRHTLARIVKSMSTHLGSAASVPAQIRAEYESAVAEFEDDNLSVAIQRIEVALSRGAVGSDAPHGGNSEVALPGEPGLHVSMDFPLLWLLRRARMRQVSDPASLASAEEQALHSLEQSKLVSTTSKRLALLKACFSQLPPLHDEAATTDAQAVLAHTMPQDGPASPRKGALAAKRGSTKMRGASLPSLHTTPPPRRSLAELYGALLSECCRVESDLGPSLIPIAKSTAEALSALVIPATDPYMSDYLCLKAEAALCLAKVLCKEEESFKEALEKAALRPHVVASLLEAADISAQLHHIGYSSAWITLSACQLYLNWRAPSFEQGDFSGTVCVELDALYNALWRCGIDVNREAALVSEMALIVVAANASEYFVSKGEHGRAVINTAASFSGNAATPSATGKIEQLSRPIGSPAQPRTFNDIITHIQQAPKGENNNAHLKRALEVCTEVIEKVELPSQKSAHLLLYPALCRLCGGPASGKGETAMPPQSQLLMLLGRMRGPMTAEDRRSAVETQCMDLLRADPAVELCGRLALVAHELHDERVVIDVCELAQVLYNEGKLGWGTRFAPPSVLASCRHSGTPTTVAMASSGETASGAEAAAAAPNPNPHSTAAVPLPVSSAVGKRSIANGNGTAAAQSLVPFYPRPRASDWVWFGRAQLLQAEIYQRRVVGMHAENREKVNLRVLQLCTNAAIAATHGLSEDGYNVVSNAVIVYAAGVARLTETGCDPTKLHASLKMMLSSHILDPLGRLTRNLSNTGAASPSGAPAVTKSSASAPQEDAGKKSEAVTAAIVTIGQCFLRCSAALGLLSESVSVLEQLFRFLPARYHKVFKVEDVRIRCQLGLPTSAVVRSARNDDPETEAAVWVAIAQNAPSQEQSLAAWKSAIAAVAHHPLPKAEVLLALAEHFMRRHPDTVAYADVYTILLAALDNVEGVHSLSGAHSGRTTTPPPPPQDGTSGRSNDANTTLLHACGLSPSTAAGLGTSLQSLTRNGGERVDFGGATLTGTSTGGRAVRNGPERYSDTLLALRIAYCLFTIADAHPEDQPAPKTIPFKEDMALVVSHYVEKLWQLAVARVGDTSCTGTQAQTDTADPAARVTLPTSLDGWFGFRPTAAFCACMRDSLSKAERDLIGSPGTIGSLFEVGSYYQRSGLETHSFLLYSWLDLCAAVAYPAGDPRCECLHRGACWHAHLCAVRCGAGPLGMIYEVPAASPAHWRQVEEQLRVRPDTAPVSALASNASPTTTTSTGGRGRRRQAVDSQRTLGSVADLVLREAEALAVFGRVDEAAGMARTVLRWAEQQRDTCLAARCHLLFSARRLVDGEGKEAVAQLDKLEVHHGHGTSRGGILTTLPTQQLVCWYAEKITLLCQTGDLRAVTHVTRAVEAAATRLRECGQCAPGTLAGTLALCAARTLTLDYAAAAVALLSRDGIEAAAGLPEHHLLERVMSPLLAPLERSTHVLHRAAAALARAHPSLRDDGSAFWTRMALSGDTVRGKLETLCEEDQLVTELLDALRGDGGDLAGAAGTHGGDAVMSAVRLYTAYTQVESQLLQLRARNDLERLRLADWVLRSYRSLSMQELGLPTGGPRELEKHVMRFVRDPVQPTDTSLKDTTLLHMDWSSYGHGELPEEVKNAFAHFGLSVASIATASRLRADVSLRAALDTVSSGPCHTRCLERLCALELQRLFEQSLEPQGDSGLDVSMALEAALQHVWDQLPQWQPVEKPTRPTKGGDKSRKGNRSGSTSAVTLPSRALTESEHQLASHLRELLFQYQHEFALEQLYTAAILFADACAFWQRPCEAAVAVETAQSAQLCHVLFTGCQALFMGTPEAKLWRKYTYARLRLETFPSCVSFLHLRQDLLRQSPSLSQMCLLSSANDTALQGSSGGSGHGESGVSTGRLTAADKCPQSTASVTGIHASPDTPLRNALVDGAALTIASAKQPDTYVVVLRHFDGAVYLRRVRVARADIDDLKTRLDAFQQLQSDTILAIASGAAERKQLDAHKSDLFDHTTAVLAPLWRGFEEALLSTNARQPCFLCLSPDIAPLPIEHTQPFCDLFAVQRELGVHMVELKQASKVARSAASAGVLVVVDPYGDHPSSVATVCPSEGKSKNADVITGTNGVRPFSDAFLSFKLQSSASNSSLLIDTCGSASTTLTPAVVSNLKLDHLNAVVLLDGGVIESAMRRDQRHDLGVDGVSRQLSTHWLAPLLLLARGVRSVGTVTFPAAPADLDAIAKRALSALSSGRSAFEACSTTTQVKSKSDGRQKEYVTLYGVSALTTKAK